MGRLFLSRFVLPARRLAIPVVLLVVGSASTIAQDDDDFLPGLLATCTVGQQSVQRIDFVAATSTLNWVRQNRRTSMQTIHILRSRHGTTMLDRW